LGDEKEMFSMVQSGAITFSILPAAFLANREESLLGWFLPYLFADVKQAGQAVDLPASQYMLKNLQSHGVVGIGYMFAGMRHVLSVKPIETSADLGNKKIRAFPCPIFNDWWLANGASPTALPLAEIAPSLTTNLLDAVDVDLDIIVGLKYHQQAEYLALTNHMAFPAVLFTSNKWWHTLSSEDKDLVRKAYHEAEQYGIETQVRAEVTNLKKLKEDGAVVTDIDKNSFKEKAGPVREKYTSKNDLIRQFASEVKESVQ
ncbi:MAG: TRAP transporter substrate-binding protein, partial [Desulfohalobiaceae bacterium]|nr:TRAP transporter substrate-binding protein [Desulfohalobiaceae bacterium]